MPRTTPAVPLALVSAAALALSGCTASAGSEAGAGGAVRIVASTNVYADIARSVAGDAAEVTAIIDDLVRDPHEYEAVSRDALAISRADIVILNGGGYDTFMETLLDAQDSEAIVIDVAELSGLDPDAELHDHGDEDGHDHDHDGEDDHAADEHADDEDGHDEDGHDGHDHGAFNEHVWYHVGTMGVLADEIVDALAEVGAADAAVRDAATAFKNGVQELMLRAADLAAAHAGTPIAITEPVPLHLLQSAGLVDATPAEFSQAIEEGADVAVPLLQQVIRLVSDGSVALLAYNEQTVGSQTQEVLDAAEAAGTPVVSFSELLPEGLDYLAWMSANLDAIELALG